MGIESQRTLIENRLITEMQLLHPGMILIGENADSEPESEQAWIRMSLTVLEITYPCLNNVKEQTDAIFNMQVFTTLAKGSREASTLVDEARSILKTSNIPGIEFLTFDIATGVIESDWYLLLFRATYRAQD